MPLNLAAVEIKAFVPAADLAQSKDFYAALGFEIRRVSDELAHVRHGTTGFLLQAFDEPAFIGNFQMHLLVENVDDWHDHVTSAAVAARFGAKVGDPRDQAWGMRDFTLLDPSGVLWRVAQPLVRSERALFKAVESVVLFVPDIEAAAAWYAQLLAAEVEHENSQYAYVRGPGVGLGFHPADAKCPGGIGGTTVYWEVDDLDAAVTRLRARGARLHRGPAVTSLGARVAMLVDPFGCSIGLNQASARSLAATRGDAGRSGREGAAADAGDEAAPAGTAAHFILYVADQARSAAFYGQVLGRPPRLDVPGMTEFHLPGGATLGLMPETGIRALLGARLPDPAPGNGTPRAELYLVVDDPGAFHARALAAGAVELSPLRARGWGHLAAYAMDPDGHVLAAARPIRAGDEAA